jgi:hypothetical protein
MRRALLLATLATALAGTARAGVPGPELPGTRPLGMGDAFLAVADDRNALYYNPAGLARLRGVHVSALGARAAVDDELRDVLDFVRSHEEQFSDFDAVDDAFLEELTAYDDRWVAADASAYVDLTRRSFGAGAFGTARVQVKADRGVYEPRVYENAVSDLVGIVGGAMPLGRFDLTVGADAKAIWRRQSRRVITAREAADFDFQQIADDLEGAEPGFSMDFGTLWAPGDGTWSAAGVVRDGWGWIGGERIDSAVDVGGAWSPIRRTSAFLRGVVVAADLTDLDEGGPFGKRVCLGAEARLPLFAVRAGAHQGYGTVGASFAVPGLRVDYAYWGRELGELPGAEGQYLHSLELRLGW